VIQDGELSKKMWGTERGKQKRTSWEKVHCSHQKLSYKTPMDRGANQIMSRSHVEQERGNEEMGAENILEIRTVTQKARQGTGLSDIKSGAPEYKVVQRRFRESWS